MKIDKDMEIYLGTDGERYEYKNVPYTVRDKVWEVLEPYKVKDEMEDLISDAAKAEEVFNTDDLESFANKYNNKEDVNV